MFVRAALLVPLVLGLLTGIACAQGSSPCRSGSRLMARADLFFGAGLGTSKAWHRFLARVVTPRFPNGLTSLEGLGQWREPRGGISKEATHVLVILYDADATSDARLEQIRMLYKTAFDQTSVLRLDSTVCAAF